MKRNKGRGKSVKMPNAGTVRASISFPSHLYETLEELAKQKKVSLAWVVRDAAEKYTAGVAKDGREGSVPDNSAKRTDR